MDRSYIHGLEVYDRRVRILDRIKLFVKKIIRGY